MGKVRHRKTTRNARVTASNAPLVGTASSTSAANGDEPTLDTAGQQLKKQGKKEQEITNLLDKLRSTDSRDRVWASSTLSSLLLQLPPLQQRLLLSRNLIGHLIERLSLPLPTSSSSSPAPPPSDDLTTAIESLGSLRNLAVSSPPHILSEMHNKRLLLPLVTIHLPLLLAYLPSVLAPAAALLKPSLPVTPAERERVDLLNESQETLRAGFWDWAENVLVLLWSLAESNTKILAALNAHAEGIVGVCMAFLEEERLGLEKRGGDDEGGMDVEGGKKKKGKASKGKGGKVPLFVAVAASQTLHAFLSSNPPAHSHLLQSSASWGFSPNLSTLLAILLSPSPSASAGTTAVAGAEEDWAQLRVLSFGVLLEIAKGRSKRRDVEAVRESLRSEEAQGVLLALVKGASEEGLEKVATEGRKAAAEIDPTALPSSHPPAGSASATLQTLERRTQTLQLVLEVLSEWLASGVPNSASLAGGDAEEDEADEMLAEEDEEEWGGVSMDVEDIAMDSDGEDEDEDDGIIGKALPEEDDGMLDDLAATAGADLDSDDEAAAKTAIKLLGGSLPLQLLSLSQPTSLAFLPPAAFTEAVTSASGNSTSSSLLSTSTSQAVLLPSALSPLSEALTTLSVRALEALNNLYVTLSKAGAKRDVKNEVQVVFEKVLGGMHAALGASVAEGKLKAETPVKAGKGKKAAAEKPAGAEEEQDENEERRLEVVMAGSGVVWGCVRLGLESEGEQLAVGPDTTPFLISSVYPSPFAAAATPAGEAIRVRTLGALGWLGRRKNIGAEENKQIGSFLLSLLPLPSAPSPITPDILLQAIDSFIDLYADEERDYDIPVFRQGGVLAELEKRVGGVRGAIKKIDRNKFPDLRHRADGALENLVAFVGYRKEIERPAKGGRR